MHNDADNSGENPREVGAGAEPGKPSGDEVSNWIQAARTGSVEAFGQLFDRCRGYLLTIARQEVAPDIREKTRPSDLVQQTLITVQKIFSRFEGTSEAELLAWLRGILLNHISDLSKFFHREKRDAARELSLERDLYGPERSQLVAEGDLTPGHTVARDEEAQVLLSAISHLPLHYREVIVLRNWERLSFDEIGRRMGRSADAVRKLWARAIDALRRHYDDTDERPG